MIIGESGGVAGGGHAGEESSRDGVARGLREGGVSWDGWHHRDSWLSWQPETTLPSVGSTIPGACGGTNIAFLRGLPLLRCRDDSSFFGGLLSRRYRRDRRSILDVLLPLANDAANWRDESAARGQSVNVLSKGALSLLSSRYYALLPRELRAYDSVRSPDRLTVFDLRVFNYRTHADKSRDEKIFRLLSICKSTIFFFLIMSSIHQREIPSIRSIMKDAVCITEMLQRRDARRGKRVQSA